MLAPPNANCVNWTTTPAYQVFNDSSARCIALGQIAPSGWSSLWSLFDATNPAAGATLTYLGGNKCNSINPPKPRSFSINFVCAPVLTNVPSSRVQEDVRAQCEYEVTFQTSLACPKRTSGSSRGIAWPGIFHIFVLNRLPCSECPTIDTLLCSGHGVCGFDQDMAAARCFCNQGWTGNACDALVTATNSMFSPLTVLIVVVIILLIALLGMFLIVGAA